jgi:putative methyltransferase (TIGR04325 family)
MKKLKEYLPPIVVKKLTGLFYGWSGNYKTWEEAKQKCSGYDSEIIFQKVKDALLKVKNGEAVYERDSVLFDKTFYSFPLLASIYHIALANKGRLNILDFGGSLGSSYYQNKKMLDNLVEYNWCVVEQAHFVKEGQNTFSDNHLHFFYDIEDCLMEHNINVALLSSVLQYIEKPYELIDFILSKNIEYIIIDRAPVLLQGGDRITIQKVPEKIYKASYPCWLLNENNLLNAFYKKYNLIVDETLTESINIGNAAYKFYLLKINNSAYSKQNVD